MIGSALFSALLNIVALYNLPTNRILLGAKGICCLQSWSVSLDVKQPLGVTSGFLKTHLCSQNERVENNLKNSSWYLKFPPCFYLSPNMSDMYGTGLLVLLTCCVFPEAKNKTQSSILKLHMLRNHLLCREGKKKKITGNPLPHMFIFQRHCSTFIEHFPKSWEADWPFVLWGFLWWEEAAMLILKLP